jgi:hypothetical protein
MVLEREPLPLEQWIAIGLPQWLTVVGAVALAALFFGFVLAAVRYGPGKAGDMIFRLLTGAVMDLVGISPRRVLALARLAIQESLRRRVLAGLAVFIVILAFALWFLDARTPDPARLYLSFVLTATSWLVLLMMVFLSAFSLPNDIKNHTIYTIVTKPVRPSEIVLGRILGFSAVGTALLAIMGLISYLFVVRALNHSHELTANDLTMVVAKDKDTDAEPERTGRTTLDRNHHHQVLIGADGSGSTDVVQGHWHDITADGKGSGQRFTIGSPQGQFHARIPVYAANLTFMDRGGRPTDKGINVGNEWTYRSYIEGGKLMSARWLFDGIRREDFPDGLRLNMTITVFRTHKGDIEKTVLGSYTLRNPRTKASARPQNFFAKEFAIDEHVVPLKLEDSDGKELNLFDDLVDDGQLEIELHCLQGGQYFGMAKPDLYLLPREGSFEANFLKGYTGIWLQMLMVTGFGVMWSTFLNGAVAMLATLVTLIAGQFASWVQELATGQVLGGNTFEAALRIVTQSSISTPLEENLASKVVQGLDAATLWPLKIIASLLPDFAQLDDASYVADGFNIPAYLITEQSLGVLAFLIPLFVVGFLCLKTREVAK